jgi:glycosyltransferase involved in cell wall biosynthesis
MKMTPKISILIPVYNEGPYISKCIESVLNQSYNNIQICISDNNSNDDTWEIICKYADIDKRICNYRFDSNIHPFRNWQKTLEMADGQFVYTLGGDDYLTTGFLKEALSILKEDINLKAALIRINYFDDSTLKVFQTYPFSDNFILNINSSRLNFLKFYLKNMNHDEVIYGLYYRKDFVRIWKMLNYTNQETNLIWLIIGILIEKSEGQFKVKYVENSFLMKRYNKILRPNNSYANHENKSCNKFFKFITKSIGSVQNSCKFYKYKIFKLNELILFLFSPRFHSKYGFYDFGPIISIFLYPFIIIIRKYKSNN